MDVKIEPSWKAVLAEEFEKDYFSNLTKFVHEEYRTAQIFPPGRQIFAAFDATPFNDVKVVILGQDPYHDVNQANGLCFSVNNGVAFPPSLLSIFKEITMIDTTKYGISSRLNFFTRNVTYESFFKDNRYTYPLINMNAGMWKA